MDWSWSWNSNTLATWCEESTHWKISWYWQRLRAGGVGGLQRMRWLDGVTDSMDMNLSKRWEIVGFPDSSAEKESACSAGDPGSIPGSGRSAGEGVGYPLQWSWASLVTQLVKNHLQCGRPGFDPRVVKIPWRSERLPTPVFWPEEFHGLYIHGVAKSWTWLNDFHVTPGDSGGQGSLACCSPHPVKSWAWLSNWATTTKNRTVRHRQPLSTNPSAEAVNLWPIPRGTETSVGPCEGWRKPLN